jgi:WD40 repeat protein
MPSEYDLYQLRNLAGHLAARGKAARLQELLSSFEFLLRKLRAFGAPALVADYEHLPTASPLRSVQAAIRLAADLLESDPIELAGQLLGRLPEADPAVARLLAATRDATLEEPLLLPVTRSLGPAGLRQSLLASEVIRVLTVTGDDRIVTAAAQSLVVWDLSSRRPLRSWSAHPDVVTALALTPDGGRLVSADARGGMRVWDFESGQLILGWQGHEGSVQDLAVLPDGRRVLSVGENLVKLWDFETGTQLLRLEGHTEEVMALAVTADGRTAFSGSRDRTIQGWDLAAEGAPGLRISTEQPVYCLALHPNGSQLISGGIGKEAKVWELSSGRLVRELPGRGSLIHSIALSLDGCRIALARAALATVEAWDGESKRTLRGLGDRMRRVAFCEDGSRLVVGGSGLEVWDLEAEAEEAGPSAAALAITPDGQRALVGGSDGTLSVWDVEEGRQLHRFPGSELVTALALSPDGDEVYLGDWNGHVWRFALASGNRLEGVADFAAEQGVRVLEWSRDGRYLVAGAGSTHESDLRVWDLAAGQVIAEHHTGSKLALIPGSLQAVVGRQGGAPFVLDLSTGQRLRRLRSRGSSVQSLAVAVDGRFAVFGFQDGSLRIWNLTGGRGRTWAGHRTGVKSIALPADGRYVASCSTDRTLRVWDPNSGACLARFTADNRLLACAVTPDGRTIVTCGFSGELHFLRWRG